MVRILRTRRRTRLRTRATVPSSTKPQPEPSGGEAQASLPDGFLPEKSGEKGIKTAQKSLIDSSAKKIKKFQNSS
jgi:hypothetical protein